MAHTKFILGALLIAVSLTAQAQMYRWTDKDGRVHYTDTPPPKEAVKGQEKNLRGNTSSGGDLPYATQEAMKNYPVRFFSGEKCGEACTMGRALLQKRGIPFHETVVKDAVSLAELKKVHDKIEFPVLAVGGDVTVGYGDSQWNAALDRAGYPKVAVTGIKLPDPLAPKPEQESAPKGPYSP